MSVKNQIQNHTLEDILKFSSVGRAWINIGLAKNSTILSYCATQLTRSAAVYALSLRWVRFVLSARNTSAWLEAALVSWVVITPPTKLRPCTIAAVSLPTSAMPNSRPLPTASFHSGSHCTSLGATAGFAVSYYMAYLNSCLTIRF